MSVVRIRGVFPFSIDLGGTMFKAYSDLKINVLPIKKAKLSSS